MITFPNLSIFVLTISFCSSAWGHGGSSGGDRHEKSVRPPEVSQTRSAPRQPGVVEHDQLEKLMMNKEMVADVAAIRCILNEFSNCRGVEVVLHDLSGKEIAKANTGTFGVVGFEGLNSNVNYVAKIESEKYDGKVQVLAGGTFVLNGEKK